MVVRALAIFLGYLLLLSIASIRWMVGSPPMGSYANLLGSWFLMVGWIIVIFGVLGGAVYYKWRQKAPARQAREMVNYGIQATYWKVGQEPFPKRARVIVIEQSSARTFDGHQADSYVPRGRLSMLRRT
jgi:hypothetical protein